jgi:hypothetical protein
MVDRRRLFRTLIASGNATREELEGTGLELTTEVDEKCIKPLLSKKLRMELRADDAFFDLNPFPQEGLELKKQGKLEDARYKRIFEQYGFISPTVMLIEDYVDFFMIRYEEDHSEDNVREGLKAEKAFDLILQDLRFYVHYPEPVVDWRLQQKSDFYLPQLGKIEVKSVTDFYGNNRVNVPCKRWFENPSNYVVALSHIGDEWIRLCGAMPAETVNSYIDKYPYHIKHSESPKFKGPFLSIPLEDFKITGKSLFKLLIEIKSNMDGLPTLMLKSQP